MRFQPSGDAKQSSMNSIERQATIVRREPHVHGIQHHEQHKLRQDEQRGGQREDRACEEAFGILLTFISITI